MNFDVRVSFYGRRINVHTSDQNSFFHYIYNERVFSCSSCPCRLLRYHGRHLRQRTPGYLDRFFKSNDMSKVSRCQRLYSQFYNPLFFLSILIRSPRSSTNFSLFWRVLFFNKLYANNSPFSLSFQLQLSITLVDEYMRLNFNFLQDRISSTPPLFLHIQFLS